ncbi:hypothetical protein MHK_009314, partial [Candidatus Magnetomorum sp. HK-1]
MPFQGKKKEMSYFLGMRPIPGKGILKNNPNISDELTRSLENSLAMSFSLDYNDKQNVIKKYSELSKSQVEQLMKIFQKEQRECS